MTAATDHPAAELDSQLNTTGGGRTQDARGRAPRPGRAARASVPGGPDSSVPPAESGGKMSRPAGSPSHLPGGASTSPRDRVRTVAGTEAGSGGVGGTRDAAEIPLPAGQAAIAAAMSEDRGPDSLEAHLRRLIKGFSLTGFHVEKSLDVEKNRKNVSVKGWPDWTIRGPRGVLFRELKSQRGRVAPEQQAWLDDLEAAGCDAGVWRPGCLLSGRIARELAAISGLRAAGGAA